MGVREMGYGSRGGGRRAKGEGVRERGEWGNGDQMREGAG